MIIVEITSGLGNQMFQYAYAKALEFNGYMVKLDITPTLKEVAPDLAYQLKDYRIDIPIATSEEVDLYYRRNMVSKIMRKMGLFKSRLIVTNITFNDNYLKIKDGNYIKGNFQSEKYFTNIRQVLIEQFIINKKSNYTKKIEKSIIKTKNSCSIHIRRGDYTSKKNMRIHGFPGLKYYDKSTKHILEKLSNVTFFIFSDDIDWAKNNLKIKNSIFVNSEESRAPHEDIFLMSLCNHNIIANSSFSWWGAWLNQNKHKIVIAPNRWFADETANQQAVDIVCADWVRL